MNQNQLREYLFQQDLAHEKEMDRLIKDAQPKKINEDYKIKLMRPPIITRDLIGPEYVAEKQLLDLSLDLQMQNTIKQAMYALDGKTPEPMKGSVTEEMIADYKKEVMKPVQIGNKFHLYRPVEIPPLVKPTRKPYDHGGSEITESQFQNERHNKIRTMNAYDNALAKLQEQKKALEDQFTLASTATFDETTRRNELKGLTVGKQLVPMLLKLGGSRGKSNKVEIIDKIIILEKGSFALPTTAIEDKMKLVEADIQFSISEIKRLNAEIHQLEANYNGQEAVDEENRLKEIEFDNKKRQLTQEILSDFNRLNQGKIEVTRQLNETDDEFIARLQQMGNIFVDPADMEKQIITEILMKAKKNILELTSDYDKAESVTRMLNNNERFQMNKAFPMIKKEYGEKFGINNKNLDDVEITQFIKNKIETGASLLSEKATETPAPVDNKILEAQIRQFSLNQFEQIIDELNNENPARNLLKGTRKEMIQQLNAANLYDATKFRVMLKIPDANASTFPIELLKKEKNDALERFAREQGAAAAQPKEDDEEEVSFGVGGGIKNHVLPSTVPFGKIALDLNKLFYQNILSIKRHNGNKIIGHKNKRVSDNFVDIIMKMFDDKPITQSDLRNIKDEQMLYDNLIVQSGLHKLKKIPTNIEQTSEQMKNRLGLLTGEIEAGNSNKSLLTELHELLFKMVRVHLISKNAAAAYYKNIKDQFFTL